MPDSASPPEWELLASRKVASYSIFDVREDRVRVPRTGSDHTFHVAESPDGVTVLAFTEERELVLVEQFRNPLWRHTLETPSGIVDEGEEPHAAGLRELREETGFTGGEARLLGTITLNPSWQTTRVHVLLVEGVRREESRELDSGEDTRVRTVPLAALGEMIRGGEIDAAVALAAISLLEAQG